MVNHQQKKKRGRPKKAETMDLHKATPESPALARGKERPTKSPRRGRSAITSPSSPLRNSGDFSDTPLQWENAARMLPSMDAVVKVFCVHTEPNFSLPWQRKRQFSSSSSGFIVSGRRVLTNAHSVEHYTQVKLKKRGSDTKYLATVLAIGTECDIGENNRFKLGWIGLCFILLLLIFISQFC